MCVLSTYHHTRAKKNFPRKYPKKTKQLRPLVTTPNSFFVLSFLLVFFRKRNIYWLEKRERKRKAKGEIYMECAKIAYIDFGEW